MKFISNCGVCGASAVRSGNVEPLGRSSPLALAPGEYHQSSSTTPVLRPKFETGSDLSDSHKTVLELSDPNHPIALEEWNKSDPSYQIRNLSQFCLQEREEALGNGGQGSPGVEGTQFAVSALR